MTITVEGVIAACGLIIAVSTVTGLAVRLILVPYLQKHLIEPMQQVRHQVTVNHHSSENPTVLDLISDVRAEVEAAREDIADHRNETTRHAAWSHEETNRLWGAVSELKKGKRS